MARSRRRIAFAIVSATVSKATAQRPSIPYLLELEQQFEAYDGRQPMVQRRTWLRIPFDGVFVRTTENPAFPFLQTFSLIHADGRVETYLEFLPFIKTGGWPRMLGRRRVAAGCQLPSEVLRAMGTEQIQGVDTLKFERPLEGGRMLVWLAPSLGCAQMQAVTELRQDGSYCYFSRLKTVAARSPVSK